VTLFIDAAQSAAAFDRDWVAVHELSHLFHPYLGDRGSWLAEGLATYYQNVLRARAGLLTPAEAWEQIDAGFSRGRRATRNGDVTLQRAAENESEHPNFMRIYWAGTAFWLETDLELRRTSDNRLSVDEAMRRFDACCLPSYRAWQPGEFIDKLDALLGTDVFRKRFVEFRDAHAFADLAPTLGFGHVAFCVGSAEDLRHAYYELVDNGIGVLGAVDHESQESIYFCDPDGNLLELMIYG